tara:strand:+ start:351 stop:650 length:300 start_codon:yes stop_codon:yes gene_type:complete
MTAKQTKSRSDLFGYHTSSSMANHALNTQLKVNTMKDLFVLPNASSVYKELESIRKAGELNNNELERLLFKALFLLEDTEAERNRHQSTLEWGEEKPYW